MDIEFKPSVHLAKITFRNKEADIVRDIFSNLGMRHFKTFRVEENGGLSNRDITEEEAEVMMDFINEFFDQISGMKY